MHHIVFVEHLSAHESDTSAQEWRETWAGLLVLRLYGLWQLKPEAGSGNAPGAVSVRTVVESLPESAPVKPRLARILESLRAPVAPDQATVAEFLRDYAASLMQRAHWSLAADVYRTANMNHPRREVRTLGSA